jgi:TP901-1 family phage major tail protein
MAILNGTVYLLQVDATALTHQTEGSISVNMETRDASTKSSGGFRDLLPGQRSGSISVSGLVEDAGTSAVEVMMTAFTARNAVACIFGLDAADVADPEQNFTASGYITSMEVSGSTEDNVTYSMTIELTGTIALDTTAE